MNKKPRIAFCFSGQARTLDQTYLFFQRNLFEAAEEQGFDYDIFCAIEDDEDVEKVNLLNPTKIEKIKSSDVVHIINDKYGDFIKNELYKYGFFIHTGMYAVLQQIYKVQRSILLTKDKNYDLILRLRFDTIFFNKFNFKYILEETKKKGGIICGSAHINNKLASQITSKIISYLEIVDLYFIGGDDMLVFQKIFDSFQSLISNHNTHKILNPVYKFISSTKRVIEKINKKKRIIIPETPINLLARFFGLQIFVGDSYYCKFLRDITLNKTNIGIIILRKDIEKSDIRLHKKTKFEI